MFTDTPANNLREYEPTANALAPDVIAIPCITCSPDDDVKGIYEAFLKVAQAYAARISWRGD